MVPSLRLGSALELQALSFRLESQNPTGSYKDQFASLAVSLMREEERTRILSNSPGNTGSALAAYATRFGLDLELYVLENAPEEKLLQCLALGPRIFKVKNFGISQQATKAVFR